MPDVAYLKFLGGVNSQKRNSVRRRPRQCDCRAHVNAPLNIFSKNHRDGVSHPHPQMCDWIRISTQKECFLWTFGPAFWQKMAQNFDIKKSAKPAEILVPVVGFEPTTYWLQISRSTNWAKLAMHWIIHKRCVKSSINFINSYLCYVPKADHKKNFL